MFRKATVMGRLSLFNFFSNLLDLMEIMSYICIEH